MEENIRGLIARNICEFLALWGIGDRSHEPIGHLIHDMVNYIYECRLEAGLQGVPDCPASRNVSIYQMPGNELRGSYRISSDTNKRGRPDYKGLDGPYRNKRRKVTRGRQASNATENDEEATEATETSPGDGGTQVPDQSYRVKGQSSEATAAIFHGEEYSLNTGSTAPSTSEVIPSRVNLTESRGDYPTAENTSTVLASGVSRNSILYCPPVSDSDKAMNVIESIFLSCLKFNLTFSQYKRSGSTTAIRTKVEEIQTYVHQVSELPYEQAVTAIKKEHTAFVSKSIQVRYIETIFWGIIKEAAKHISPDKVETSKGRLDDFTPEEKAANAEFMKNAGIATGRGNKRRCRRRWRNLYDMREAGIDRILLYRTAEFNSFCEKFPSDAESTLVDTVMSWEKEYGPQICRLEDRIKEVSKGDLTGRSWLKQPKMADRLKVPEASWNSGGNHWHSEAEAAGFKSTHGSPKVTSDQLGDLSDDPTKEVECRNMTLFITLNPKSEKLISVCPIVTIKKGDFLGVFAGYIRYSESFDETYGIGGPLDRLWLDYSQATGMLNLMRVSRPDGDANVHLQWERFKPYGESQPVWRVAVRALREIKPFEEMIRSAHHELQYLMHQESACARRGFLRAGC